MRAPRKLLKAGAPVAVAALHGLAIALLVSTLEVPTAPKEVVIEVILAPPLASRRPPPVARDERPAEQPDRPTMRAQPPAPARAAPDRAARDWTVRPADPPAVEDTRRSLRSAVGCQEAKLLALTKAERAACEEKLAAGAKNGPVYAVVSPKLQKQFDGVFECPEDDVWCEYRIGKAPYPGLFAPRKKKRTEWD